MLAALVMNKTMSCTSAKSQPAAFGGRLKLSWSILKHINRLSILPMYNSSLYPSFHSQNRIFTSSAELSIHYGKGRAPGRSTRVIASVTLSTRALGMPEVIPYPWAIQATYTSRSP